MIHLLGGDSSSQPILQHNIQRSSLIIRYFFPFTTVLVAIAAMADTAPSPPSHLLPDHTYLHITSPPQTQPQQITQSLISSSVQLKYVGMVGELQGEHIYEVTRAGTSESVRRDGSFWLEVKDGVLGGLKGVQGVKAVKVMDTKQRVKRDEF